MGGEGSEIIKDRTTTSNTNRTPHVRYQREQEREGTIIIEKHSKKRKWAEEKRRGVGWVSVVLRD